MAPSKTEPTIRMPFELGMAIQEIKSICDTPGSKSQSFTYGSEGYKNCIRHFLASSSEVAQLAVQPGSVKDVRRIMKVLKKHRNVQFAVKGGGHGMAPGFSSTTGIQISMTRFSKIKYNPNTQLVEIGSGCLWDQVYSTLAPTGRNVIGGASSDGVGVGGWLLGGGYSLKSNRYGLGIDNIVAIDIVIPDGRLLKVSQEQNNDLFQALRGGGNNFGIVTKFTLKTFAQNATYGSYFLISGAREEEFKSALLEFIENEERPEACVVAAFRHELVRGKIDPEYSISIFCVFDADKPKQRRYVPFKSLARLQENGDTYAADPAGWQLGKTSLALSELELKTSSRKSKMPTSRPGTPQSKDKGRRGRSDDNDAPPSYNDLYPKRAKARNRDAEDSDAEGPTGYFQEMSWSKMYGIANIRSSVPKSTFSVADSSDDSDDDSSNMGDSSDDDDSEEEDSEADLLDDDDSDDDISMKKSKARKMNKNFKRTKKRGDDDDDDDDSDEDAVSGDSMQKTRARKGNKNSKWTKKKFGDDDDDSDEDFSDDNYKKPKGRELNKKEREYMYDDDSDEDLSDDSVKKTKARKMNKTSQRAAKKFRDDWNPVMWTKPIDKMGELNERGRFGCLMISKYTKPLLDKMEEEAKKAASYITKRRGLSVIIDAWPVHQAIFDNSPPGAAFLHVRGQPYGPMLAYFRWQNKEDDEFWLTKLKGTLNRIRVVARNLGLTPKRPAYYNNLSLESVSSDKIYRDNMKWLKEVKKRYDPYDVMGRAGGHKIPLPTSNDAKPSKRRGDDSED